MLEVGFGGVGSGCESGGCVVVGGVLALLGVLPGFGFGGRDDGGLGRRGELYDEDVCREGGAMDCGPGAGI